MLLHNKHRKLPLALALYKALVALRLMELVYREWLPFLARNINKIKFKQHFRQVANHRVKPLGNKMLCMALLVD
jgi:hypothetical protein